MKISFGATPLTIDPGYIDYDGAGGITVLREGFYSVSAVFHVGRANQNNAVDLVFRTLINGSQDESTKYYHLDGPSSVPMIIAEDVPLNASDVVTFELARMASGVNDGGLYAGTIADPGLSDWNDIFSASVFVDYEWIGFLP